MVLIARSWLSMKLLVNSTRIRSGAVIRDSSLVASEDLEQDALHLAEGGVGVGGGHQACRHRADAGAVHDPVAGRPQSAQGLIGAALVAAGAVAFEVLQREPRGVGVGLEDGEFGLVVGAELV